MQIACHDDFHHYFFIFANIMSTFSKFEHRLSTKDLERRYLAGFEFTDQFLKGSWIVKKAFDISRW